MCALGCFVGVEEWAYACVGEELVFALVDGVEFIGCLVVVAHAVENAMDDVEEYFVGGCVLVLDCLFGGLVGADDEVGVECF